MKLNLKFVTDYRQFYLNDKNANGNTGSENFWSESAFADKLAIEDGVLGIGIENDEGKVECEFEILNSKSLIDNFTDFDHVVEASLKIHSGILQIIDCPNSEVEMETEIDNGEYRVRVYSINLNTAYEENSKDSYKIEMWKEAYSDRKVLKRFED
jgi:transcription elongation factor Elf1